MIIVIIRIIAAVISVVFVSVRRIVTVVVIALVWVIISVVVVVLSISVIGAGADRFSLLHCVSTDKVKNRSYHLENKPYEQKRNKR